ncbi:type IV secretion system protein, partial [Cetobacterium sp.]|uniref:type IV secretion system protein n=1 Tax=Cetobacterium sp. TaxID=2071632 RepID=UPI003EE622D5
NYKKSLYYLSRSASSKFDNYLKEEKYVEKKRQGKTVEIVFNTGLKVSDNTYQIRWKQITYSSSGELEDVVNYNGLLTIGFKTITDPKVLYKNPLGLIVTEFSQKKELL